MARLRVPAVHAKPARSTATAAHHVAARQPALHADRRTSTRRGTSRW
jgi:hypothetical protein